MAESEPDSLDTGWSRRRFLGTAAVVAGQAAWAAQRGRAGPVAGALGSRRSRVVKVRSDFVVRGHSVHDALLMEMLESGLTSLTGAATATAAWHRLLRPSDVIGLKFNQSGQEIIGTTPALADALVRSLYDAGWPAGRVVCIEAPAEVTRRLETQPQAVGFEHEAVDFGSGRDRLARVLRQVTALIDVPFIKTHNIAGMTCALKNLSHGLIKHPARLHGNGCSPYIADIVALPQIRNLVRLCVADGLRVAYDGGPDPGAETIADAGVLLLSTDLVAVESVAFSLLNDIRSDYNCDPVADNPRALGYLAKAADRGLGTLAAHEIDLVDKAH